MSSNKKDLSVDAEQTSLAGGSYPRDSAPEQGLKFAHRYRLVKNLPSYAAGRSLSWNGSDQRFYFKAISTWKHDKGAEGIYLDKDGPQFTVEQIQDREWFEPIGRLVEFIPPFPSQDKLDDFIYLTPDCRLVDDVDECRAINAMLNDGGFQERLYEFYKAQYESFHGVNVPANKRDNNL